MLLLSVGFYTLGGGAFNGRRRKNGWDGMHYIKRCIPEHSTRAKCLVASAALVVVVAVATAG